MDPACQLIVKYLLPDCTHSFSIEEIDTLHTWMNGKGISSMEPSKFSENKEKLQNLMEEKDKMHLR